MGRLLGKTHREEYATLYAKDPVYAVLKASLSGLYGITGSLRLGIEEIFVNTYAAIDEARREYASSFFSAAGLLDGMAIAMRDEAKEEHGSTRDCTDQDILRAVVVVGACACVGLSASLKFSDLADELDAELRSRDARLYGNVTDRLCYTLFKRDRHSRFTEAMRRYVSSGEYLSDALLAPDAPRERRLSEDTLAGHKRRARRLLKALEGNNKKGRRILADTDCNRVVKAVDSLIENGRPKSFTERIKADATQKEIREIFYKLYLEGVGDFDKQKWAQFLKATFSIFENQKESTIATNLSR